MTKCPNCDQETARTMDWACQWCGYPLLSNSFKEIPKTYKQLRAERLYEPESPELEPESTPELESTLEPEPELTAEPKPEPIPEVEPEPIPEPEPEPVLELAAEPVIEPEPEPTPEPEAKPIPASEPEVTVAPESKPTPELASEPPSPETGITVAELYSAYGNKMTADARLTNQTLKVTGTVEKVVVNDIHEIYYIILASAEKKAEQHVRCTFDKKDRQKLNQLTEGQAVTVQGEYEGYRINIILKDCVLAS